MSDSGEYKQCAPCRKRQADISRSYRRRQKAATVAETNVSTGKKRAREDSSSPEERPARRARSGAPDVVPENLSDNEDDNDDGPNFGGSINAVCQFSRQTDHLVDYIPHHR